ncbi:hypothetical protein ANAEL_01951 [Anaerolineales bacterium]|nr:hypothetical protein ANAEL_01951 [Anaerolineales bacterium]
MKKNIILVAIFVMSLCICACSKAPKCSDSEVTSLTLSIVKDILLEELANNKDGSYVLDTNDAYDYEMFISNTMGKRNTWEKLKQSKTPSVVEYVKNMESKMEKLKLESIRASSKDDTLKKCNCEADVKIVDNDTVVDVMSVKYTAQKTEDGKLRVEVDKSSFE